nr:unnamed protein product [Callosobruchus chinensis]
MAVNIVFQNCISSQPLISSLSLKTCCPFSPNTFRNSRNEENVEKFAWIQDPFHAKSPQKFTSLEEESLIELSCDNSLKSKFASSDLVEFWVSVKNEYPALRLKALRILIPFATSYLCEAGFSAVAVIKSKYRSKINVEQEMRVAVSSLIPRFESSPITLIFFLQ